MILIRINETRLMKCLITGNAKCLNLSLSLSLSLSLFVIMLRVVIVIGEEPHLFSHGLFLFRILHCIANRVRYVTNYRY